MAAGDRSGATCSGDRACGDMVITSLAVNEECSVGAVLTVDLQAVVSNYCMLRRAAGSAACAAVVKADGYGLGALPVVRKLCAAGCRQFFVATANEALLIRPIVPKDGRIYVLSAPVAAIDVLAAHRIVPVVNSIGDLETILDYTHRVCRVIPVALQIDTGLSRLGVSTAELPRVRALLSRGGVALDLILSHLANAVDPQDHVNRIQLHAFRNAISQLPRAHCSLAASSGIFLGPEFGFDLVRPGAALYGINPAPWMKVAPVRDVITLRTQVLQIRTVRAGTGVGYGPQHLNHRDSKVATVALGYADGLLRSGRARGCLWHGRHRLPVLGAVSMDCMTVDVTDIQDDSLKAGSWLEVIGPHQSIDALASALGTIGYEVLVRLGHRFHRRYVDHDCEAQLTDWHAAEDGRAP